MRCYIDTVLDGCSADALAMNENGYSVMQYFVIRNIPFCDSFTVCVSEGYYDEAVLQIKTFHDLDIEVSVTENISAMRPFDMDDIVYVADCSVDIPKKGYKDLMIKAIRCAEDGMSPLVGRNKRTGRISAIFPARKYGYRYRNVDMIPKPSMADAGDEDIIDCCEDIIAVLPSFKDYLWGGTLLRDRYDKDCDMDIIAESWELSAHPDGPSRIASGRYSGMDLDSFTENASEKLLGWKCAALEKFPILIKFIDAEKDLSVQVHPNDRYALVNEGEYGKNELWYVIDCKEGSSICYGLNREVSEEELMRRAKDDTITQILNEVKVHPGESYFIKAGTIHAIGAGVFVCEVQQSSNCTYRLYDYSRKDRNGNLRELHLNKACDVACRDISVMEDEHLQETFPEGPRRVLGSCRYFVSELYDIREDSYIEVDRSSFVSIMVIKGSPDISCGSESVRAKELDSFFIPAGDKQIHITGECTLIVTRL